MYLTFYLPRNEFIEVTFEDLLNNPYMSLTPKENAIKKTVEITEEYANRLYEKKPTANQLLNFCLFDANILTNVPKDEISNHYSFFRIRKKSNPQKFREIYNPDIPLRNIHELFKKALEDMLIQPHNAAHAYIKKRSTLTAKQVHQRNNSNWSLKIDLKDFFPSHNKRFLTKQLKQLYPLALTPDGFIDDLVDYALLNDSMPQGTSISPMLSNLSMVPIDYKITEKLMNYNKHHYVYTRYADDIEISCKEKFNPQEIINIVKEILKEEETPFKINESKTKFGSKAGKNFQLGLILNKDNKISVGHEKNQKFRAAMFQWCLDYKNYINGEIPEDFLDKTYKLQGHISYYKHIEPNFVEKVLNKYNQKFDFNIKNAIKYVINKP